MVCISAVWVLASCSPMVETRGHALEEMDFSQIIVGQAGQDDVRALLGSPSATSQFGTETWYYISERKETMAFLASEVADQKVVAVEFDGDKLVSNIEEYTKEAGKPVQFVSKETPTEGKELNAIEQMMGNFGRFNTPGREIDPRNMRR